MKAVAIIGFIAVCVVFVYQCFRLVVEIKEKIKTKHKKD